VNMQGEIIYEPVKIAQTRDGRTYVEIRTDVYRKHRSIRGHLSKLLEARGIADKVDWQKIDKLIKEESGVAEDVSLQPPKGSSLTGTTSKAGFTGRIMDYFKGKFRKTEETSRPRS